MTTATDPKPTVASLAPPKPSVGRIVHFQTDERGGKRYVLPAIVTCTFDSHPDRERSIFADGEAHMAADHIVEGNPVPVPDTDGGFVHLHVLSPGPAGAYTELTVPFDDSAEPAPRSWHWPPRT